VSRLSGEGLFNERLVTQNRVRGVFVWGTFPKHHHSDVAGPQRYNVPVPAVNPQRRSEPRPAEQAPPKSRILTLEATGVLIVAVLVLILTLVRYWHHIPWSAR
jgi:hypothetical protein